MLGYAYDNIMKENNATITYDSVMQKNATVKITAVRVSKSLVDRKQKAMSPTLEGENKTVSPVRARNVPKIIYGK